MKLWLYCISYCPINWWYVLYPYSTLVVHGIFVYVSCPCVSECPWHCSPLHVLSIVLYLYMVTLKVHFPYVVLTCLRLLFRNIIIVSCPLCCPSSPWPFPPLKSLQFGVTYSSFFLSFESQTLFIFTQEGSHQYRL